MAPLILAGIQALMSAKQKKDEEQKQRQMAAAQGQAFQSPNQSRGVGQILDIAGGFLGGKSGAEGAQSGAQSGGMSPQTGAAVDGAMNSFDSYLNKRDGGDYFGGIQ